MGEAAPEDWSSRDDEEEEEEEENAVADADGRWTSDMAGVRCTSAPRCRAPPHVRLAPSDESVPPDGVRRARDDAVRCDLLQGLGFRVWGLECRVWG